MLEVLTKLHACGYSYNDLKPEQLLHNPGAAAAGGPAVMMVDFGAVTQIGDMKRLGNTWRYSAPEAQKRMASGQFEVEATFGEAFDTWTLCMTLAVIALGGSNPYLPTPQQAAAPAPYPHVPGCSWSPHMARNIIEDPWCFERAEGWDLLPEDLQAFLHWGLRPEPRTRATLAQLAGTNWGRAALALGGGSSGGGSGGVQQQVVAAGAAPPPLLLIPGDAAAAPPQQQPRPRPLHHQQQLLAQQMHHLHRLQEQEALALCIAGAAAATGPDASGPPPLPATAAVVATPLHAAQETVSSPTAGGAAPGVRRAELWARVGQLEAEVAASARRASRHSEVHRIENQVLLTTLNMMERQLELTETRLAESAEREEALRADARRLRREHDDARRRLARRHAAAAEQAAALFEAVQKEERRGKEERRAARMVEGELQEELRMLAAE
ncbi:hypothetical protein MNEG_8837, partial [Monoraphidium neglectum]